VYNVTGIGSISNRYIGRQDTGIDSNGIYSDENGLEHGTSDGHSLSSPSLVTPWNGWPRPSPSRLTHSMHHEIIPNPGNRWSNLVR